MGSQDQRRESDCDVDESENFGDRFGFLWRATREDFRERRILLADLVR